jgi:predicted RND superfamily exporter protein
MSNMSKRIFIAATVMGVYALGSSAIVSADSLTDLHQEEFKIHAAAAKSQKKINALFEQSQELLVEYRSVVDQTENLKVYNDYLAGLVADQQRAIDSLQRQIDSIEETKQGIVPLMFRMIDSLDKFVDLDIPINLTERKERIQRLRDVMSNSNVTVSEQFRQVIEAYQIENEYGTRIQSYQGTLNDNGTEVTVDFFNLGRTALLALSLDQTAAWRWDNDSRKWERLGDEYLNSVVDAVKMAQGIIPADLIKLPIKAAE